MGRWVLLALSPVSPRYLSAPSLSPSLLLSFSPSLLLSFSPSLSLSLSLSFSIFPLTLVPVLGSVFKCRVQQNFTFAVENARVGTCAVTVQLPSDSATMERIHSEAKRLENKRLKLQTAIGELQLKLQVLRNDSRVPENVLLRDAARLEGMMAEVAAADASLSQLKSL